MAKKLNKPRNILLFQNLYPINLYISDIDNKVECSTLAHESIHYADAKSNISRSK